MFLMFGRVPTCMDFTPKYLQIFVYVFMGCLYGAIWASTQENSERQVYNFIEGQNFTKVVDITDADRRSNLGFYYVQRNYERIIKLLKHDYDGNGSCYRGPFLQQCESHSFSLSYDKYGNGRRSLRFTIQRAVAGTYQLKPYYNWVGNYSEDPLAEFTLQVIKDAARTTTDTPVTLNEPQERVTSVQKPTELPPAIKLETAAPVKNPGSLSGLIVFTPIALSLISACFIIS